MKHGPNLPHFFYSANHDCDEGEDAKLLCCRACYLTPGKVDPDDSECFAEVETWWCQMATTCNWCHHEVLAEHHDLTHLGGETRRTCAYCLADDAEDGYSRARSRLYDD